MAAFATFLPGLFAGSLFSSLVTHWLALLLSGWRRNPIDAPLPTTGRVLARIFTVIHPVPWLLLVGIPYGIHRFLTNPPTIGWRWFLAGFVVAFAGTYVFAGVVLMRRRAQIATENAELATRHDNVA
jgi:hypothetical protein